MLIEYKKVTVCQKDGIPVLKDVDFHVSNGEFVYIIGKVGSGKSSLLKTIYAELFIDEGEEAKVLDQDITGWKDKKEMQERIEKVLSDVGMSEKINKMPHELSGGEKQRIAIARAILNSPKLIVADEPTANLDPETADGIMQLMRQISQTGTAVIMSTHNMPLLDKYPGIVYRCFDEHLEEVTNDFNKMKIEDD